MDLAQIKAKLAQLNDESNGRVDNSDKFWKVPNGKTTIRIVPSKYDPSNPFTELKFHTALSKFPILALSNFNEQDPVEQLIEKLRETSDKDNWSLSGKISPRPRYFAPVIVRGEEDKGVRIWSMSTSIYKALLTIAADDEYGDFTDIQKGFDLVVEKTPPATQGAFADITVRAKRNESVLSESKSEIEKWLSDQPDVISLFRKPQYDWLKKQLESYLKGGSTTGAAVPTGEAKAEEEQKAKEGDFKLKNEAKEEKPVEAKAAPKKTAKSTTTKFDDLFGGDDEDKPADADKAGAEDKFPWEQ